jgi:hypothetical protein
MTEVDMTLDETRKLKEKLMKEVVDPLSLKEAALAAFQERKVNPPKRIDNASLYAGSDMYFYCRECGALADVLPESYMCVPKRLCSACQTMKDNGWLA